MEGVVSLKGVHLWSKLSPEVQHDLHRFSVALGNVRDDGFNATPQLLMVSHQHDIELHSTSGVKGVFIEYRHIIQTAFCRLVSTASKMLSQVLFVQLTIFYALLARAQSSLQLGLLPLAVKTPYLHAWLPSAGGQSPERTWAQFITSDRVSSIALLDISPDWLFLNLTGTWVGWNDPCR